MSSVPACCACKRTDKQITAAAADFPGLSRCSGCKGVFYCSRQCQKGDWNSHKNLCKQLKLMQEKDLGFTKTITKEGESKEKPQEGDVCMMHYLGRLPDGTIFDQTRKPGNPGPFQFALGRREVIAGWDQGVATMCRGEHATLVLSPEMAYGDSGIPGAIPPKSPLVFDVELVDFKSRSQIEAMAKAKREADTLKSAAAASAGAGSAAGAEAGAGAAASAASEASAAAAKPDKDAAAAAAGSPKGESGKKAAPKQKKGGKA